ncbi:HTH-type transcriptional activator RhaS [Paenibacillus auburnensis]|uniref:HTH-type transcriptional activator RhaS n=1 Tax=Paenibacillus auburnensis TaxID=2905649 RepID=A0ABM9CAL0_9BACL|nr:helix-turn-helix domain-containing protein [Paenibacillus auburnensis]CAH1208670.1 HTH-type transcriptional activator RhaS [Paenibacillus auburnensis]
MRRRVTAFVKGKFRSMMYRFFFCFLVLASLIQLVSFINYRVNLGYLETQMKENYNTVLSNIADGLNNVFTEIYSLNYLLSLDEATMQVFSSNFTVDSHAKYARVSQSIRSLARIRLMNEYIDNVFIYKKRDGLVISDQGTYPAADFFGRSRQLELYTEDFWNAYGSQNRPFQILPPSRSVSQNGAYILPVVQTAIAEYKSNDLFVISVKVDSLVQLLMDSKLTPNSKLFVLGDDRQVIASTEMDTPDVEISQFLKTFQAGDQSHLKTEIGGNAMLAIQMNTRFVFKNLNMVALVPVTDIEESMSVIKFWGNLLNILALLLSVLISFLLSRKLYAPLQSLIVKLPAAGSGPPANEYKLLDRVFHRMLDDVSRLNDKLTFIYPMALEQWMVNLLRFKRLPDHQETEAFLQKSGFSFEHSSFVTALIRVKFAGPFLGEYSKSEQNIARNRILQLLKEHIPAARQWIVVEIEDNVYSLLANVPQLTGRHKELNTYFTLVQDSLHMDHDVQETSIGVGETHPGFAGLQESYLEAMKAIWRISPLQHERIHYSVRTESEKAEALLSAGDSRKIFNVVCSAKKDELSGLLETVVLPHLSGGLNEIGLKELYLQIFVIGSEVLKHKDTTLPDGAYREYFHRILSDNPLSVDGTMEFLTEFLEAIMEAVNPETDGPQSVIFKQFIDMHYQEEIHLDLLADKFHTTSNYMSRLLKKELGKPFHQYLQELRIGKAKELLARTDLPIQDIWAAVGFNNRNSFIRSFRKLEGISPTDYRNQFPAAGDEDIRKQM